MVKKKTAKRTSSATSAKKRPAKKAAAADPGPRIAKIDREILGLLQQRAALVVEAAKQAAMQSGTEVASGQEAAALSGLVSRSRGPLPRKVLSTIFREVQSGCRSLFHPQRIALLGPLYSYSHLAALSRFGHSVEFVPVGSIAAVFEEVNRGHSEFGLVPVENSTDGRIADTLDMFTRLRVRICGQVEMAIHHTLLGNCARTEVKEVYSRPQALSQCRNWLAKHLPTARTIEVTSTSTAAQLAKEKPGAAAIASFQAGIHYGLKVLAERIEDDPGNLTRFAVIGGESAPRTGNDSCAILFQTEHRFGALVDALAIFKRNRLNLTWIESFPVPGSDRAYLFFVELEGHETEARVRRAIATLKRKTLRLEVLGSFPAPEPVD